MTAAPQSLDITKIKHVVFDLDHTLWDYNRNSSLTLTTLYLQFGLQNLVPNLDDFIVAFKVANEAVWLAYSRQELDKWELRNRRFAMMERHLGLIEGSLPNEFSESYLELCPQQPHLMDGTVDMLARLSGTFELHILTNGFADTQLTKLWAAGIHHFFTHVITSEKLKAAKPHAEIFHAFMNAANATPNDCLMIGDNPEADVWGAQQVGWQAIHYAQTEPSSPTAHAVISHWDELPKLLGL